MPIITDTELLDIFADTPCGRSNREYLLAIGRAIEAKARASADVKAQAWDALRREVERFEVPSARRQQLAWMDGVLRRLAA